MWQVKRNDILPQLDILSMVPPKLGVPSSEYYWVRGKGNKVLFSAASYIGGEVSIEGKGDWPFKEDFYVDKRLFVPFIKAARELKDKHVFQFEKHKKQLVVRHGSRKVTFDSQPHVKGYGNASNILKRMESTIPVSQDLKDMLLCGKNCAVADSVVPHLNTVYIQKSSTGMNIKFYATSEKVIFLGVGKVQEKIQTSIPFPLYLINFLETEGLKKIILCGKFVVLQFEKGIIWQPISQEAIKHFPLKELRHSVKVGASKKVTFTTSSRRFSRLMLRLGYYLQGVQRKDWVVNIKGIKAKEVININTSLAGARFDEKLSTLGKITKDFKLEWPLDLLDPVFMYLSKKTKKLGLEVRVERRVSYISVGKYWLSITAKQE